MSSEAEDEAGDDDLNGVVGGMFGITSRQVTKLFEPVEAPLNKVPAFAFFPIKSRRA